MPTKRKTKAVALTTITTSKNNKIVFNTDDDTNLENDFDLEAPIIKLAKSDEKNYNNEDDDDDNDAPELVTKSDLSINKLKEFHESLQMKLSSSTIKSRKYTKRKKLEKQNDDENDDNDKDKELNSTILKAITSTERIEIEDNNNNNNISKKIIPFKIDINKTSSKKMGDFEVTILDDYDMNDLTTSFQPSKSATNFLKNNGPGKGKSRVSYTKLIASKRSVPNKNFLIKK